MKHDAKSRRARERLKLALPVRVYSREAGGREWAEVTRLTDVTPFGAGFPLTRPTEPGRLLSLSMPLPRQLRCYDYAEAQYGVWALVRQVRVEEAPSAARPSGLTPGGEARFQVGVAFVGKHPPASYLEDPLTRYEVATPAANDLWSVHEQERSAASRSKDTRLMMAVEVTLEVLDVSGATAARETTVTENVSRRGAAIFSTLKAERGQFVRLTSVQTKLSLLAAVRARRTGADGIPRLHVEFVGQQWPLEGVE